MSAHGLHEWARDVTLVLDTKPAAPGGRRPPRPASAGRAAGPAGQAVVFVGVFLTTATLAFWMSRLLW